MKFEPIKPVAPAVAPFHPGMPEYRRFARREIHTKGTIRHARRRHPVKLENLSEQGCQFWLPLRAGLPVGAAIELFIAHLGPFGAVVRWHHNGWTGVQFDYPVYLPVLDHIHATFEPGKD